MLIERGVIVSEGDRWVATGEVSGVEIPDTLQGLLLARIDQLPDAAKRSLRVASVIGRQFPVRVLERVIGEARVFYDARRSSRRSRKEGGPRHTPSRPAGARVPVPARARAGRRVRLNTQAGTT